MPTPDLFLAREPPPELQPDGECDHLKRSDEIARDADRELREGTQRCRVCTSKVFADRTVGRLMFFFSPSPFSVFPFLHWKLRLMAPFL